MASEEPVSKYCLKCGYQRTADDLAPESECPNCGAIYAKVEASVRGINRSKEKKEVHKKEVKKPSQQSVPQEHDLDGNAQPLQTRAGKFENINPAMGILVGVALVFLAIYMVNHLSVSKPLYKVLESDPRNSGIDMTAHYKYYLNPSQLILNVERVSAEKSMADVFRVVLQYASEVGDKEFEKVFLASKGETKFFLKGNYFSKLGEEYDWQNPVYTMRTFPSNVYTEEGTKAFPTWEGGLLGVTRKQMENFREFNTEWYMEDVLVSDFVN